MWAADEGRQKIDIGDGKTHLSLVAGITSMNEYQFTLLLGMLLYSLMVLLRRGGVPYVNISHGESSSFLSFIFGFVIESIYSFLLLFLSIRERGYLLLFLI